MKDLLRYCRDHRLLIGLSLSRLIEQPILEMCCGRELIIDGDCSVTTFEVLFGALFDFVLRCVWLMVSAFISFSAVTFFLLRVVRGLI